MGQIKVKNNKYYTTFNFCHLSRILIILSQLRWALKNARYACYVTV